MKQVQALAEGDSLDAGDREGRGARQDVHVNQTPTTVFHCKGQTYP